MTRFIFELHSEVLGRCLVMQCMTSDMSWRIIIKDFCSLNIVCAFQKAIYL